ncbi:hypothetical protein RDABS01_005556 [Bienertia sinuspersici]
MQILHQTSLSLLNPSEFREAAVNPMGCISVPMGFIVQSPAFGAVSNVRRKKKQAWGLVSRRHSFIRNARSVSHIEGDMVVKKDTGFKSSFDDYSEAKESVRANRVKKNAHRGSERGKKLTDTAFSKDVPRNQKHGEAVKFKWVRSSDSKVDSKTSVRSDGVADKKRSGSIVQKRNSVSSEKKLSYVGSKSGLSKKLDVTSDGVADKKRLGSKWVRSSDSKVDSKMSVTSDGVADKKRLGSSVQKSYSISSEKELSYVGSKSGLSKKLDVMSVRSDGVAEKKRLESKWIRCSDSKVDSKTSVRYAGVADKKRLGSSVQKRNSVSSEKELSYVGSKSGLSRKLDVTSVRFDGVADKKRFGSSVQKRNSVSSEKELSYVGSKSGLSKKLDVTSGRSDGVADKKSLGSSVQTRNSVSTEKELSYVGSKGGLSKKLDVHTANGKIAELSKKKIMTMNEMSVEDDLEMDRFIFQPSELSNDGLDVARVSQMEMEERIQKLAISLNNADMDMPEWLFAKTMRSARIRFSDHSMLRIIKILGKFRNWRRVLQLIEWLQTHERFRSHKIRYVYTAALDVLGKARRPVEALNLFYAMQRHKTTYPDIVTYHSIAVNLGQAGHMKELFDVIDSMRSMPKNFSIDVDYDWDPRLEPDVIIYNAVLNGCVKQKEWEGAVWVLQKLEETGQQPSSTTYGLVMEVMLACGKYDLVHEYFKLVQRSSVPNALTYRVVVNTLWREGKPDVAIAAVQDMESRGVIGSASLYYDLARCLCSVGRCEEGLMQVDKICKVASKPLVVTYTGLIQACLANGNIHDAASIFNLMQKHCSPNTVTCNIMLKAYLGHGMFDEAKELFRKMTYSRDKGSQVKNRIRPDLYTFNTMLEACIREKRWDEFEYAYDQMLQRGHPFNTKRHLWMVLQASAAGKVETVELTWSHFLQTNRVPPPALIKERFRLKMENDNLVEAVSSVARHPSTHQQSFSKESWLQLLKDNAHCFKKEALEHLIREVNNCLSTSESPNLIYRNLLDSCMEFVRHDILATG